MKLYVQFTLLLFLSSAIACSQAAPKPASKPAVATAVPELDQVAEIQTLTENHKILLIRVAGDLSKVSEATKTKITAQTNAFNAALEQLKSALMQRNELSAKLKILLSKAAAETQKSPETQQAIDSTSAALKDANEMVNQLQDKYDEQQRQFATLIETVKSERSKK